MWGVRAIRVGFLLGGLLAAVAGSGCCQCGHSLWGTKSTPAEGRGADVKETDRKPNWRHSSCPWWDENTPKNENTHLTPERIHGGIY